MKTVFRIFLRDLKRIGTNWVAVVIALGVCLIPSLYAWVNILANWDPYNNTSTVPIAVVIEDEGADVQGMGYTNAGDLIRDQLKQNDQLKWTFVDEHEALTGVKDGSYYAAFVIPEDFTASIADVMQGDTAKADIQYYVNEKVNAISPKVTDTGSTTLETQITEQFVDLASKTITEKLQTGVTEAAGDVDGATRSATAELRDAQTDVSGLAGDLSKTAEGLEDARGTVSQARDTLKQVRETATGLDGSLGSALDSLASTRKKAQTLTAALSASIGNGAATIAGISSTAAMDIGQVSGSIGWATGKLDAAIAQLKALNGQTVSLKGSLETTRDTLVKIQLTDQQAIELRDHAVTQIDRDIEHVVELSSGQLAQLDRLQRLSDEVKAGNQAVSGLSTSVNAAIQSSTQALVDLQRDLSSTTMPELSGALDSFSAAGGQLKGASGSIPAMLDQADATLGELDQILAQSKETLAQTASSLDAAAGKVGALADDTAAIQSALTLDAVRDLLSLDPEQVGDFMGAPVDLVTKSVFPVKNYGSGVAPFYTNLALWVGGFVLVAIYKLEVDREGIGEFKPWQGFFGRWLLMNLLGQMQAIICCVGDLALGIQCLAPAAFVFAGMVQSFVYVFFVYAISVAFKHIGKAIGVLLVILQIPGTSGVYPIEMMPDFFQNLRPWLPFTYGINAMREAIAGFYGDYYAHNLLMLLIYLIPALLIGVTARKHLLNVNNLFDRRLGDTDLMITERVGMRASHFRLATIVKVMMNSGEYRQVFLESAAQFELMYPKLVKRGFLALIWFPLVLLTLAFITPHKFLFLMCWIASLVIICGFLIVVEYLHTRVAEKTALTDMSSEELYALLDGELKQEFMAFAPIQKMRLDYEASRLGGKPRVDTGHAAPEGNVPNGSNGNAFPEGNVPNGNEGGSKPRREPETGELFATGAVPGPDVSAVDAEAAAIAEERARGRAARPDAGETVEMPRVRDAKTDGGAGKGGE